MNRQGWVTIRTVFFVILLAGILPAVPGEAFEPWEGRATTGLNVRNSPRVGSQVTAWLQKGQEVTVKENKDKWCRVLFEGEDGTAQEGWVHGGYLEKIPPKKQDISSALARVRSEIILEDLQEKTSLDAPPAQGGLIIVPEKQGRIDPPAEVDQPPERSAVTPSRRDFQKDEKNTLVQKSPATEEQRLTVPYAEPRSPEKNTQAPFSAAAPVKPALTERTAPVVESRTENAGMPGTPPASAGKPEERAWTFKKVLELALRLLSIVLSCLAILISYKAIKVAEFSYRAAMECKQNLQDRQQPQETKAR